MNEFTKRRELIRQSIGALRDGTRACNNLCNGLLQDVEELLDIAESESEMREAMKNLRGTLSTGYGWTLRQTATAAGVSPTQLSKWTAEPIVGEPDIICGREV